MGRSLPVVVSPPFFIAKVRIVTNWKLTIENVRQAKAGV